MCCDGWRQSCGYPCRRHDERFHSARSSPVMAGNGAANAHPRANPAADSGDMSFATAAPPCNVRDRHHMASLAPPSQTLSAAKQGGDSAPRERRERFGPAFAGTSRAGVRSSHCPLTDTMWRASPKSMTHWTLGLPHATQLSISPHMPFRQAAPVRNTRLRSFYRASLWRGPHFSVPHFCRLTDENDSSGERVYPTVDGLTHTVHQSIDPA